MAIDPEIYLDMSIPLHVFDAEENIMATYKQQHSHDTKFISAGRSNPSDTCLLVFTSSASDAYNLKCVPLTHDTVLARCQAQISWLKKSFPITRLTISASLAGLRGPMLSGLVTTLEPAPS